MQGAIPGVAPKPRARHELITVVVVVADAVVCCLLLQVRAQKALEREKAEFQSSGITGDFALTCSFQDLLQALYPSIPHDVIGRYIHYYDFEQDPKKRKQLSRAQIRNIFCSYDTNGDGSLTEAELKAGLQEEGMDEAWELYSSEIKRFDFNGDSVLCMDEFIMWMGLIDNCADFGDGE